MVLTGAGISQESGLKTFRDEGGLWEGHRVEEVASPEAFRDNPELVYRFYNLRRAQLKDVKPNKAHMALAEYEKTNSNFLLVTQNVDDLHEKAGSRNILHMHGQLNRVRTRRGSKSYEWTHDLDIDSRIEAEPGEILRPDIVWFGEIPKYMEEVQEFLKDCELFVSIGTSGSVYPAAAFVEWAPKSCRKVELNLQESQVSHFFDENYFGKASEIVVSFFANL